MPAGPVLDASPGVRHLGNRPTTYDGPPDTVSNARCRRFPSHSSPGPLRLRFHQPLWAHSHRLAGGLRELALPLGKPLRPHGGGPADSLSDQDPCPNPPLSDRRGPCLWWEHPPTPCHPGLLLRAKVLRDYRRPTPVLRPSCGSARAIPSGLDCRCRQLSPGVSDHRCAGHPGLFGSPRRTSA